MNYYPFHIGDYHSATAHLSPLQDCAYRRMLDRYYMTERALPADLGVLCRLIRMDANEAERQAVATVAAEFFFEQAGHLRHNRCEHEIASAGRTRAKARASANARWQKENTDADALRSQCEGNAPNPNPNTKPNTNNPPTPQGGKQRPRRAKLVETPAFAAFWKLYPRREAKQAALRAWLAIDPMPPPGVIRTSLERAMRSPDWLKDGGAFIPHPATWLNGRRWEDEGIAPGLQLVGGAGKPLRVASDVSLSAQLRDQGLTR